MRVCEGQMLITVEQCRKETTQKLEELVSFQETLKNQLLHLKEEQLKLEHSIDSLRPIVNSNEKFYKQSYLIQIRTKYTQEQEDLQCLKSTMKDLDQKHIETVDVIKELEASLIDLDQVNNIVETTPPKKKKKSISIKLKQKVWDSYFGPTVGSIACPCCQHTIIRQIEFHCGHKVPEALGGLTKVENLIPLCAQCNLSMGTQMYDDFKASIQ